MTQTIATQQGSEQAAHKPKKSKITQKGGDHDDTNQCYTTSQQEGSDTH